MLNLFQHLILFKTEICHAELVSASHPLKIEIIPSNASPLPSLVSRLFVFLPLCLPSQVSLPLRLKSLYLFTSSSQVSLSPVSLSLLSRLPSQVFLPLYLFTSSSQVSRLKSLYLFIPSVPPPCPLWLKKTSTSTLANSPP
jgi:hypothetical protein